MNGSSPISSIINGFMGSDTSPLMQLASSLMGGGQEEDPIQSSSSSSSSSFSQRKRMKRQKEQQQKQIHKRKKPTSKKWETVGNKIDSEGLKILNAKIDTLKKSGMPVKLTDLYTPDPTLQAISKIANTVLGKEVCDNIGNEVLRAKTTPSTPQQSKEDKNELEKE